MTWYSKLFNRKYLRAWLIFLGIVIALIGFEEVVDDVFHDPQEGDFEAQEFDDAVRNWVFTIRTPHLTQAMIDLTSLGSISVVVTLLLVLVSVLATYRDFKGILYLITVGLGAGVWPLLLKVYFGRERPGVTEQLVKVTDLSFPSGHAFGAAAIYIGLAYYCARYARDWSQEVFFSFLGAVLILLVGISRIYLGVHYPTDVMAGLCGGAAWGLLASLVIEVFWRWERSSGVRAAETGSEI